MYRKLISFFPHILVCLPHAHVFISLQSEKGKPGEVLTLDDAAQNLQTACPLHRAQ